MILFPSFFEMLPALTGPPIYIFQFEIIGVSDLLKSIAAIKDKLYLGDQSLKL